MKLSFAVVLIVMTGFAQAREADENYTLRKEIDFILHLIAREDFDAGLHLLDRLDKVDGALKDSVNYLSGWGMYRQKNLEMSALKLLKVREESPVFYKSRFFGAYNLAHVGRHQHAQNTLTQIPVTPDSMHEAMQRFQLSGVALLQNDFDTFHKHASLFDGRFHVMAQQEHNMLMHRQRFEATRTPSPFLAGMLSAAVPGLGRVYAGKSSEGIISFLYLAAMGLTTYDFYRGGGAGSPIFIISASVTGIFYAGNIYGSAVAARRVNQEFRHEMEQRILFDMHIPLRNAFN